MSLKILGAGTFLAEELEGFAAPPAWRKATRNMIMTTASIERALAQAPELRVSSNPEAGFVLGSAAGELETSAEFMGTWSKSRMARPVLFQNSLHNATTGFASIHFKLIGPAFTMSAIENTPEECVGMAEALINENSCRFCIVTLIEGHKALADRIGESGVLEGACTLILSDETNAKSLGARVRADLNDVMTSLNYRPNLKTRPLLSIADSGFFACALELGAGR